MTDIVSVKRYKYAKPNVIFEEKKMCKSKNKHLDVEISDF